ncbi:hypothetical protein [Candidatus Acidianus copahuensis]|nr:hypothetical protein [Candidatus Acidianus copahuensis]
MGLVLTQNEEIFDNLEKLKGIARKISVYIDENEMEIAIPENPLTYVTVNDNLIYINGNDWDIITKLFNDVKQEIIIKLKRFVHVKQGIVISDVYDKVIKEDDNRKIKTERIWFYSAKDGKRYEVGMECKIYLPFPERGRNGFVEISLFFNLLR